MFFLYRFVPDFEEKAALARSGLGEKSFAVFYYAEAEELYDELLMNFPQLCESGDVDCRRSWWKRVEVARASSLHNSVFEVLYLFRQNLH